jgi:hypothetical protein
VKQSSFVKGIGSVSVKVKESTISIFKKGNFAKNERVFYVEGEGRKKSIDN